MSSRAVPLVLLLALAAGCSTTSGSVDGEATLAMHGADGEPAGFGPLAVHSYDQSGSEALTGGEIEITDDCVLLHNGDHSMLLLWSALRTSWDAASRTVVYQDRSGNEAVLGDGDMAAFGGGDSSLGQGGQSVEDFLRSHDWLQEPDPACLDGGAWFVGEYVDPAATTSTATNTTTTSSPTTTSSTTIASSTTTAGINREPSSRPVRILHIVDADPGILRGDRFEPESAPQFHRWTTTADLDQAARYLSLSLSGVAEPGDSGCLYLLESDGMSYGSDYFQWGTTNDVTFSRLDSVPSVFDAQNPLPYLAVSDRHELEAEIDLTGPEPLADGDRIRYDYVLDGSQTLAGVYLLAQEGRSIQGELYVAADSRGELQVWELDGRLHEIKLQGWLTGQAITGGSADSYRPAARIDVTIGLEDLPGGQTRVSPDMVLLDTPCER